MPTVNMSDLLPDVPTDPEMAVRFLRHWFREEPVDVPAQVRLFVLPGKMAFSDSLEKLIGHILNPEYGLDGLVYDDETTNNVYFVSSWMAPGLARWSKGKDRDAIRAPGVWGDYDARPGSFSGVDDILRATERIGFTALNATGSGGVHGFGRVRGGLSRAEAKLWNQRVHAWVEAETGLMVDDVSEPSRLMRLPGTLRWPKASDDVRIPLALVETIHLDEAGWLDLGKLDSLTHKAWDKVQARRRTLGEARRAMDARGEVTLAAMQEIGQRKAVGRWEGMWALSYAQALFNETVPWESVLEPHGWRKYGAEDSEGRQSWTRPGGGEKNPRSLLTGWLESPNVASLQSRAPETGLVDLKDAGLPLTKARIWAELQHGGDMGRALWEWIRQGGLGG